MNDIHIKYCDVHFYEVVDVPDEVLKEPSLYRLRGKIRADAHDPRDSEVQKMIRRVNGEVIDDYGHPAQREFFQAQ